jgi:hypothetical protein
MYCTSGGGATAAWPDGAGIGGGATIAARQGSCGAGPTLPCICWSPVIEAIWCGPTCSETLLPVTCAAPSTTLIVVGFCVSPATMA